MFTSPTAILIILAGSWFYATPDATRVDRNTVSLAYMADTKNFGRDDEFSFTSGKSMLDLSVLSAPRKLLGLGGMRLGFSGMVDRQGTYLVGPGIGKTVDVGRFDVTLSVYPSYSVIRGDDRETASGHMNWKTTFDVAYHSSSRFKAGVGLMHISNGGYRDPNRGIEALRFSMEYDF
jgi:hypothetical protein